MLKNILLVFLLVFSVSSQTMERVTIKNMIGRVEVRSTSGKWRAARLNMQIKQNWDIRTYVESKVELKFANGTVLKLGENSVVSLGKLFQDKAKQISETDVKIANGQIWANVKKLVNKNSDFKFETPTAVAAIRGTKLGLDVKKGKTVVDVYKGKVAVRNKGSNKTVLVGTKNRAVVRKGESGINLLSFEEASQNSGGDTLPAVLNPFETVDSTSLDSASADSSTSTLEDTTNLELFLELISPVGDIKTSTAQFDVIGTATPGVTVSCLGVTFVVGKDGKFKLPVVLVPGNNPLKVSAKLGDAQKSIDRNVFFEPPKELYLDLKSPSDKSLIKIPTINISGSVTPGALVYVNSNSVSVVAGQFTYKLPIPDEEGEYSVDIVAEYNGKERSIERTVTYSPERVKNFLILQTPRTGDVIKTDRLKISGKTLETSNLTINGKRIPVGADGGFVYTLKLTEKDIGNLILEIISEDPEGGNDINKSIDLSVDGRSKLINRSFPTVFIIGGVGNSTRYSSINFGVSDLTPDDRLSVTIVNNDSRDVLDAVAGDKLKVALDEGKNSYKILVEDVAGNISTPVTGSIYYLPGPIDIDIIEPNANMLNIDDLPPMPKNTGALKLPIRIELDDGIGDVPETILYCKVNGVSLKESSKYTYTGTVTVHRGSNLIQFTAKDIAGNKSSKSITLKICD